MLSIVWLYSSVGYIILNPSLWFEQLLDPALFSFTKVAQMITQSLNVMSVGHFYKKFL